MKAFIITAIVLYLLKAAAVAIKAVRDPKVGERAQWLVTLFVQLGLAAWGGWLLTL